MKFVEGRGGTKTSIKISEHDRSFRFRVHAHSRGVLISGFRLRGSANQEWTLIGSRSPQEEQRYYPISKPLQIRPDDCLIARLYQNSQNSSIKLNWLGSAVRWSVGGWGGGGGVVVVSTGGGQVRQHMMIHDDYINT